MRPWLRTCTLTLALIACGDDPASSDDADVTASDTADVEDYTGRSPYRLETEVNGQPLVLERELTHGSQHFAFGSTRIAPAVSLAMTDSVTFPRTMIVTISFGIVVPSDTLPVHTDAARTYAFSATPPGLDVFVAGLQYRSTLDGATGELDITQWSTEPGAPVAGTFSGTLVAVGNPARTWPVSGHFHFTLPDQTSGQPR